MEGYCKVLIIDDEFIMRQGMKHMFDWEKEGFQVVGEATNGQEGLELVAKLQPNIVLADIVMPVLDGIEFSKILKVRYPDVQLIILSSYDKFEYVKETLLNGAADYILKPTLEPQSLLKTLKKAAKNIPGFQLHPERTVSYESILERVLSGYQEKLEETVFQEVFPYSQFRILAINLKLICGSRKLRMAKVEDEIQEILGSQESYTFLSLFMDEVILCIILNYRMKDQKNVMNMAEICAAKISNMYEDAFFVVSESCRGIQNLKRCYKEEIEPFVNQRFYYPGQHLIMGKRTVQEEIRRFAYEEYTGNLLHKQFPAALEQFGDYIRYICQMQMDEYKMKNQAKNLLYNYLMEIEKYGVPSDELRQLYFKNIDDSVDVGHFLCEIEREMEYLEKLIQEKVQMGDQKIAEIRMYIYEHYQEDLDLADLAHIFGFSYHYLSSYFNQYAKEGFSEYLNRIRVEKACELLKEKKLTISEISHRVGYADHSYFCRVFKKITGDTPSDYRRKECRK